MTAITLEVLRTEAQLPSIIPNGNPDFIEVIHDFSLEDKQDWIDTLVAEARVRRGDVSAQATRRALGQPANALSLREDGDASTLLRSVGLLRRPSGRVAGVVVCQWLIRADRVQIGDEDGGHTIELALSRPLLYAHGATHRPEVYEATLLHALRQMEVIAVDVVKALRQDTKDNVAWTSPASARDEPFLQEAHRRLLSQFYASNGPQDVHQPQAIAA